MLQPYLLNVVIYHTRVRNFSLFCSTEDNYSKMPFFTHTLGEYFACLIERLFS